MTRLVAVLYFLLALTVGAPASAQEQEATDTPQEKLKKMRALEGRLPQDVISSFKRRTVDSSQTPWTAVGRINHAGRAHCTGALVAKDLVLTAAHCVYSKASRAPAAPNNLHFVAGYSKGDYLAHSVVLDYFVPEGFNLETAAQDQKVWQYDWALLQLAEPIGEDVGFIALHPNLAPGSSPSKGPLLHTPKVTTAGYAGDRPHILSLEENCRIRAFLSQSAVMLTDCPAISGDSGGPILQQLDGSFVVIGITTIARDHKRTRSSIGVTALAFRDKLGEVLSDAAR